MTDDVPIQRGDSGEILFALWVDVHGQEELEPLELTGDVTLAINWRGGSLVRTRSAGELVIDQLNGIVIWPYSSDDSSALPLGRVPALAIAHEGTDGRTTEATLYLNVTQGVSA